MGGARRSARAALPSVSSAVPWHPALVPRGDWGAPSPSRALVNLRTEPELVRALAGGLAALSARESLGLPAAGRWTLGEDGLPRLRAEELSGGAPADTLGDLVRLFLVLFGSRPAKGSDRPVIPRRHPHGAAIAIWCARWTDASSGAREALVDFLEVLETAGLGTDLPAAWGVAAPWTPAPGLGEPGLRRICVKGPASRGALAAWCDRAGVRRVALGETAPYPFACLEPLVRAALGMGVKEVQGWLSGRLDDPARLARDLAGALASAGCGYCLWPSGTVDLGTAGTLERCAASLPLPILLAGSAGSPAGTFGELSAVALPRAGEVWFRLHALAAAGDWDAAVESACSRPEGLARAGTSLFLHPSVDPVGTPTPCCDDSGLAQVGPGAAIASLREAVALETEGRADDAALRRAHAHVLAGQTEVALSFLEGVESPEAEWFRAKVWERRQDFAGVAASMARVDLAALPPGIRAEARVLWGQAAWLAGDHETGMRFLEAVHAETADPDAAVLAALALATCRLQTGAAEEAHLLLAEAGERLPRCRRPLPAIVWHQRQALLHRKRGLYGRAAESFSSATRLAAAAWDHWMEAVSLLETGNVFRLLYRFDEARDLLRRAEEGFCTLGLEAVREKARFDRMLCDAESGHLLEAQEALQIGLARPARRGEDRAVDRYWLARVLQLRGEPSPALEQVALALEELRSHPDTEVEAPLRILRAKLLLDAHQTGRLRGALEEIRPFLQSAADPDDRLDAASVLLEASARAHVRPGAALNLAAEAAACDASPGPRARWALAHARARGGDPTPFLTEALTLGREISDPSLEAKALWELATRGHLPALDADDTARVLQFLTRNRLQGEERGLLPLLSARWAPTPIRPPEAPASPLCLLEEARRGQLDLQACAVAAAARGALLRAPGSAPQWAGTPPTAVRAALAEMAGLEGLIPSADGWILGALGRGGTWVGFSWGGPEPPPGESAALARLWTAVLPPLEVAELPPSALDRPEPLLERLLLGKAPALLALRHRLAEAAPFSFPVLLTGEPGVGKEACARALHLLSARASKPWVPANCANLSPTLAASLLFGHRRGAFTGADRDSTGLVEAARGGTLFLDEVGELPAETQAQVLRFLQDGSYAPLGEPRTRSSDARVVAATNRDLERAVAEGVFRADLFHRLNVIRVEVPPLRERLADVPLLFGHFLGEAARAEGRPVPPVAEGVWGRLAGWRWPGNVRELQNLARSLLVAGSARGQVREEDLPEPVRLASVHPAVSGGLKGRLLRTEQAVVQEALARSGGNVTAAARELGITRQALARKLARGAIGPPAPPGGRSTSPPAPRSLSPWGGPGREHA